MAGNWNNIEKDDICKRIHFGLSQTNGEKLYAKRHSNAIIKEIAEAYDKIILKDEDGVQIQPTDERKEYFNECCKMYYCFIDKKNRDSKEFNSKINSFFCQENKHYKITFFSFSYNFDKFLKCFWNDRKTYGLNGFLTLFCLFCDCDQNKQQTKNAYSKIRCC